MVSLDYRAEEGINKIIDGSRYLGALFYLSIKKINIKVENFFCPENLSTIVRKIYDLTAVVLKLMKKGIVLMKPSARLISIKFKNNSISISINCHSLITFNIYRNVANSDDQSRCQRPHHDDKPISPPPYDQVANSDYNHPAHISSLMLSHYIVQLMHVHCIYMMNQALYNYAANVNYNHRATMYPTAPPLYSEQPIYPDNSYATSRYSYEAPPSYDEGEMLPNYAEPIKLYGDVL